MGNPNGTPIWYELKSVDPDASKAFYEEVIGWTIQPPPAEFDYRMIDTGNGLVGGLMRLNDEMAAGGARAGWRVYIGVDDVDATTVTITDNGGRLLMGPWDLPGVGRMAIVTDPQGVEFYVMRGASDGVSTAWSRTGIGKCSWNELATTDQAGANGFYATVFGWTYPDAMPMGEIGDYIFVAAGGETIGATMPIGPDGPPADWRFYFRVPDIEIAAAKVVDGGGTLLMGPIEVPGGERVVLAGDPHGLAFGIIGPGKAA